MVTQSLAEPWQNRSAARDAVQQIMALHEHLARYLNEQGAAVTETLLPTAQVGGSVPERR